MKSGGFTVRRGGIVAGIAAGLVLAASQAHAATFEPTRLDDPAPNGCRPNNCSLREAMQAADQREGRDTVVLSKGRYELEIPNEGATLYSGSLDLVDGLILRGEGPGQSKIDANGLDQVLTGWLNGTPGSFDISGLTLTGGIAGATTAGFGGGIAASSEDTHKLTHLKIKGNEAPAGGGGLSSRSPKLTITDSTITDNEAPQGGGLWLAPSSNSPKVNIRGSTVSGNEALFGGGIYSANPKLTIRETTIDGNAADEGGGLDLVSLASETPVTAIRASTISGNSARKGGGILADGNQPTTGQLKPMVSLLNSTVALNHTSAEGGGIMADNSATVNLDNATVAYNTADDDNIGGGVAGGVYQHSAAIFGLADSIVAENSVGSSGTGPQCDGSFVATAGGVVESQATGSCTVPGSNVVPDALIGTLGDNGGPTQTIKLLSGSPAIAFDHEGCPKRDQRGKPRPEEDCDSGAFERKGP